MATPPPESHRESRRRPLPFLRAGLTRAVAALTSLPCCVPIVALLLLIALGLCFGFAQNLMMTFDREYCIVYILLLTSGLFVVVNRYVSHRSDVLTARAEDKSYVQSIFRQVDDICVAGGDQSKLEDLRSERDRVEKLRASEWTEYEILPLERKLARFYSESDLIAKTTEKLNELNEYAQDSHYRYDIELYFKWEGKINELTERLVTLRENNETGTSIAGNIDWTKERLKSEYNSLLEHICSYKEDWNEGSTIIRNLLICTVSLIILFLFMGIVPLIYPVATSGLTVVHWGLLGAAGALTAVARDFRQSDLLAVGNTEGKKELWRAILGSVLGFIAGMVLWALMSGDLLAGAVIFPTVIPEKIQFKDVALSVFWAIVAGFSFDRIFDYVRAQGEGTFR